MRIAADDDIQFSRRVHSLSLHHRGHSICRRRASVLASVRYPFKSAPHLSQGFAGLKPRLDAREGECRLQVREGGQLAVGRSHPPPMCPFPPPSAANESPAVTSLSSPVGRPRKRGVEMQRWLLFYESVTRWWLCSFFPLSEVESVRMLRL